MGGGRTQPQTLNPNLNPIGFTTAMIGLDIMDVFHLGVGRDVAGAAIKVLCKKRLYYDGRTIWIRLGQLMAECKV